MSTLLLPELAREMAGSNRRVADSLEAEARQLKDYPTSPEEREALKRRAARSARSATMATLSRKAETLSLWQSTLDAFKDGLGDVPSKNMLPTMRDILDSWLRLARNSRDLWKFAEALGTPPEGLDELGAAEAEIERVKAAVEQMDAFLTRSRPPVDAAPLQRGREEIAQGRYRTAEEIRAGRQHAQEGTA